MRQGNQGNMDPIKHQHSSTHAASPRPFICVAQIAWLAVAALLGAAPVALAQGVPGSGAAAIEADARLLQCAALSGDNEARLRCFDALAASRQTAALASTSAQPLAASATPAPVASPVVITMAAPEAHDCKNPRFSKLSRFWELEAGSDCGTFGIRGYHPTSWSVIGSDSVNTQPSSSAAGHTAATATAYNPTETRIQVSVRTKVAEGLLTGGDALRRDSLWFGYTQQSYWQLFSPDISRPFRNTDHEPEVTYIYPTDADLPGGWRLRYSGLSLVHQSNGQSLPLSRSWNRAVLMTGMEKGNLRLTGRIWHRLPEDAGDDDNPEIADTVGRAELAAAWDVNPFNTLAMTVRHSWTNSANGSVRLEWLKSFGDAGAANSMRSGLRFHTQLFSGYGDSLLDYNRRRTVLSVGLSLVDW